MIFWATFVAQVFTTNNCYEKLGNLEKLNNFVMKEQKNGSNSCSLHTYLDH
jgi:hypothetical protein